MPIRRGVIDKAVLFALFLIFNVILSVQLYFPVGFSDEYAVLAVANRISNGANWMSPGTYHGYAHSLLFSFLFYIFDDISKIYISALCINSILTSFMPVFCYKILDEIVGVENINVKRGIAFTVSIFPFFSLHSKHSQNETLLFVIMFICIYLLGKNILCEDKKAKMLNSIILGFLINLAYAAHGIGLVFIIAMLLTIVLAKCILEIDIVNHLYFICSFALFYIISDTLRMYFVQTVWHTSTSTPLTNTLGKNFEKIFLLLEPEGIVSFIDGFIARIYYIASSTYGVFLFSIMAILACMYDFIKTYFFQKDINNSNSLEHQRTSFIIFLFSILLLLGGLSVSNINNMHSGGTFYFYARYFEYMIAPIILFGLCFMFQKGVQQKTLIYCSIIYLFLSSYVKIFLDEFIISGTKKAASVYSVLPFLGNSFQELFIRSTTQLSHYGTQFVKFDVIALSVFTAIVFIALALTILKKRYYITLGIISICYIYVIFFDMYSIIIPTSAIRNRDYVYKYEQINKQMDNYYTIYKEYPNIYLISGAARSDLRRFQLVLNKYTFQRIKSVESLEKNPNKFDDYFIISFDDYTLEDLNSDYVQIHSSEDGYIWIRGHKIANQFE